MQESAPGADRAQGIGDNFMDRVVKYIPAEVLAIYLSLDRALVTDATKLKEAIAAPSAEPLSWSQLFDFYLPAPLFCGLCVLTPFYFRQYAALIDPDAPWRRQGIVAMIAFAVWAYAIQGGAFMVHGWYVPKYAMLVVVLFTTVSAFFPAEERKNAADAPTSGSRAAIPVASVNSQQPKLAVVSPATAKTPAQTPPSPTIPASGQPKGRL